MKICVFGILLMAALLLSTGLQAAEMKKIDQLAPEEISGWKSDGNDGTYNRENLYDYIDGGAEVYLAYAYKEAFARRYVNADQPAITVDIFDMGTSEDAYGIFSFEREGKSMGVGQDSEYASGFLRFWKGRYFVSILADKETPESKNVVFALGKAVADAIADDGARPKMLGLLPSSNLVAASTRFFHQKSGLDYHYLVADKNILNLSGRTNVVLAQFKAPVKRTAKVVPKAQALIVEYPVAQDAVQAYGTFMKAYLPEAKGDSPVKTEGGKFTVARQKDRYVVAIFDAPDPVFAGALIDAIVGRTEVKPK